MVGEFVTAKLHGKGEFDCRQGWIKATELFTIEGQSGETYLCGGVPVTVDNPPKRERGTDG